MSDGAKESRKPGQEEGISESVRQTIRMGAGVAATLAIGWETSKQIVSAVFSIFSKRSEDKSAVEEGGRKSDRKVTLEEEKDLITRRRAGTFFSGSSFLIALLGGIGFLVAYWTGGSNEVLGGCLALFFAGMGATMVIWSHALTTQKEAVEPRESMKPPAAEERSAREDFCAGRDELQRRGLLKGMVGIGVALIAAMGLSMLRSLGFNPSNVLYSTVWKRGQKLVTIDGKPVRVDALVPGSTAIVFPEDSIGTERAQTVLIRVEQQLLQLPAGRKQWAPGGNLAFSRVCTHAGCSVGMYLRTSHQLMCPCHQSTFDVLRAAEPCGGPAARALPQLPIYVDEEGILRAGGGFSEPPGPGFWGMPS